MKENNKINEPATAASQQAGPASPLLSLIASSQKMTFSQTENSFKKRTNAKLKEATDNMKHIMAGLFSNKFKTNGNPASAIAAPQGPPACASYFTASAAKMARNPIITPAAKVKIEIEVSSHSHNTIDFPYNYSYTQLKFSRASHSEALRTVYK